MAQLPELDFAAYVRAKQQSRIGGTESTGHDYAYVSDKQMKNAFARMRPVETTVAAAVRMFQQIERTRLLGNSVKVSERQFPRIHGLVKQCADTLQIATPRVYIVNSPTPNAATYGTNEESFIMVHSSLIDHFTDDELLSVLGHECGHIHNSHVVYLTALHLLTSAAGLFIQWAAEPAILALKSWSRRAEITCDRAGMLCSKNEQVAARALTKLALGSKRLYEEFNLEAFLDQYEESKDGMGKYTEIFATHPWIPKRVLAMRAFGESELFRSQTGLGEGGITMPEVDKRVLALLRGEA